MVSLGGVEQEQRVPGRRRVDDDEAVLGLVDDAREGAEDRHLLGARRPEVFLEKRSAGRRRVTAPAVRIASST